MGLGALIKTAITKVQESPMHPVAKVTIMIGLFAALGVATYFGIL